MKVRQIRLTPTGEVRPPRKGEWYKYEECDCFSEAVDDWRSQRRAIYTCEEVEVEVEPPVPEWCMRAARSYYVCCSESEEDERLLAKFFARHWRSAGEPTPEESVK